MKHITSHSKSSLFLMEIIFSLLILSLSACICVQLFANAKLTRKQAREWNHIQELTVTAGEFLEGTSGEFLDSTEDEFLLYYDDQWNPVSSAELPWTYCMKLKFSFEPRKKTVYLRFFENTALLYEQEIAFPVFTKESEVYQS